MMCLTIASPSRSLRHGGSGFVHAVEALVVEVFFGDANAVVFDRDVNGFAFGFEAQGTFTVLPP